MNIKLAATVTATVFAFGSLTACGHSVQTNSPKCELSLSRSLEVPSDSDYLPFCAGVFEVLSTPLDDIPSTTTTFEEDEFGWNCYTDGNRGCGSSLVALNSSNCLTDLSDGYTMCNDGSVHINVGQLMNKNSLQK